jgi:hypothetical protein
MVTRLDCQKYVGRWVRFRTPFGWHRGIIEDITDTHAVIVSPDKYVPAQLASQKLTKDDLRKIDATFAFGSFGGPAGVGVPGYGMSVPGYGGFWGGASWSRWAVAFLIIYLLFGLWAFCW